MKSDTVASNKYFNNIKIYKKLSCRRETARCLGHTLRETDGRTDGQKAVARTRYAVCIARKKG